MSVWFDITQSNSEINTFTNIYTQLHTILLNTPTEILDVLLRKKEKIYL